MENKDKELKKAQRKKIFLIIEIALGILFILAWVVCIVVEKVIPDSQFTLWVKENVWDIDAFITTFMAHVPVLISCIIYIILITAVSKILRTIFKAQMKKSDRTKTVITLFDGFVKYGCAIALIILVLKAFGVNTTALIASVGVLTLVIGLGAQSLIADIIAGMFIIFENGYNVGEIVSIDNFRGTVSEIGIRSTKILDAAGNIKIINNSDIANVVNMSRELSLAVVDCEFPYDVAIEKVEKVLKDSFPIFKEKIPAIVEGPFYKGVSSYGDSNVVITIVAKCSEEDRYQVQRDLMREYRQVLLKNNIDLAYPQVVVTQKIETEQTKASVSEKRVAEKFVEDQKVVSSSMEEQTHE
ncbi:MAG: mechanosensitive ion channel family protein [Bacilli bacterium]